MKNYGISNIIEEMFRPNFMVLGLDDVKFVDLTFIKAAYVK